MAKAKAWRPGFESCRSKRIYLPQNFQTRIWGKTSPLFSDYWGLLPKSKAANHSSPSSADVKNIGAIHPVTLHAVMACIRITLLFDVSQAKISSLAFCFEITSIYVLRLNGQITSYLDTHKGTRGFIILFFRPKRLWNEYLPKLIQTLSPITAKVSAEVLMSISSTKMWQGVTNKKKDV